MSAAHGLKPVFAFGSDSPADMLNNAAAVCRFLSETATAFADDGRHPGLSETASMGLVFILDGIETTINEAIKQL